MPTAAKPKTPSPIRRRISTHRQAGVPRGPSVEGDFPCRRCVWRPAAGLRLTTEQMQYHFCRVSPRSWRAPSAALPSRRRPSPPAMARRSAASPDPVRQRTGGEDGGIRCRSAGQHRLNGEGNACRCAIPAASLARSSTALPAARGDHPGVRSCDPAEHSVDSAVLDPRMAGVQRINGRRRPRARSAVYG